MKAQPSKKPMPIFEKRTIGDCTLYRGDSLELLKAGTFGKIGAIVSDPPYGIGYQHGGGGCGIATKAGGGLSMSKTATIIGDDQPFYPAHWIEAAPRSGTRMRSLVIENEPLIILWGADNFKTMLPVGGTLLKPPPQPFTN